MTEIKRRKAKIQPKKKVGKKLSGKDVSRDKKVMDDYLKKEFEIYHFVNIVDIDWEKNRFTLELAFADPSDLESIKAIGDELARMSLIPHKSKEPSKKTKDQHRQFFAMLTDILKHRNISPNSSAMRWMYNEIRNDYFPVRENPVGDTMYYSVPSIKRLSKQEMSEVLDLIYNDFTLQGVDFEKYKEFKSIQD